MKKQHKDIILKALATQIMLTEQAIIKGECLIDGVKSYALSEHIWEETAIHAQLVHLRKHELQECKATFEFVEGVLPSPSIVFYADEQSNKELK